MCYNSLRTSTTHCHSFESRAKELHVSAMLPLRDTIANHPSTYQYKSYSNYVLADYAHTVINDILTITISKLWALNTMCHIPTI